MFLTLTMLPVWAVVVSVLTFLALRSQDPEDLTQYQDKVLGLPLQVVCFFPLLPLGVWLCYEGILQLGPKGPRTVHN
uniref:Uncharacterized protein n=1 Tax=Trypanosoma vivax (strain Y486) TaxID=1055687 RepID=G0U656_TRYVY|nr:conserved hypothetical protein [Trypanosoma vivax Y486]